MKWYPTQLGLVVTLIIIFAVWLSGRHAVVRSVRADRLIDLCGLYLPQDLVPLSIPAVGSYSEDPFSSQCRWATKNSTLAVRTYKSVENAASIWMAAREKYGKQSGASLKDEPGIGTRAFSTVFTLKNGDPPPGAVFFIIQKNQHLLTLSLEGKGLPTEHIREQLRTLAKKADAATL
jgi:hypothetical protein